MGGQEENPLKIKGFLVRETGLEPASSCEHMNLNHARLPIPPFPHITDGLTAHPILIFYAVCSVLSINFCAFSAIPLFFPFPRKCPSKSGARLRFLRPTPDHSFLIPIVNAVIELIFHAHEGAYKQTLADVTTTENLKDMRDIYPENVGTILVGASKEHMLAAMADPRIDFIIPFHRSGSKR